MGHITQSSAAAQSALTVAVHAAIDPARPSPCGRECHGHYSLSKSCSAATGP